uniref:Major facilitator superfamily (MFS) profile domain-containing protein n=1 Tax=Chromera velia CCMP2878 TaxID=1169474 RepID=A0A0G4HJQ3_9ALVE|eukprot:Cvel_7156.t1-p1 / transcript=Cvel_7156.t1 / gene=Cvel_7156 / organism=Chromera_velia_CCMP2878 / gene_product=High affinity nitrate transporter 2.7, putative / transcript_product=High affinity nitrate transporter 2.7, putative / location=Cvel_scaffold368:43300-46099(-) / protein_length=604 / sequence_SO=supercontig / SO=protein_coding / is_pseudo=false
MVLGFCGRPSTDEAGRATDIRFLNVSRPHMRGFHASWTCFFMAFFSWFSIAPLLPQIKESLSLTKEQVAESNAAAVASTVALRVIIGPICDYVGPRLTMCLILISGSIPVAFYGLVTNAEGLLALRFFIGFLGAAFVSCQFWTSLMFAPNTVGAANAFVGGWGNLGAGFTLLIMPLIFDAFNGTDGVSREDALAYSFLIPATVTAAFGVLTLFSSDDCPQGKYANRVKPGETLEDAQKRIEKEAASKRRSSKDGVSPSPEGEDQGQGLAVQGQEEGTGDVARGGGGEAVSPCPAAGGKKETFHGKLQEFFSGALEAMRSVFVGANTWILIIHYAMCFGVELTVNNFIVLYFYDEFRDDDGERVLSQSQAAWIAAAFPLCNIFARALGGLLSDYLAVPLSFTGRIMAHGFSLLMEGVMLLIFTMQHDIWSALGVLIVFSIFTQMAEGTTFGLVPFVSKHHTGMVAGLVGAGGNAGALLLAFLFRQLPDRQAFRIISYLVMGTALASLGLRLHKQYIWPTEKTWEAAKAEKEKKEEDRRKKEQKKKSLESDSQPFPQVPAVSRTEMPSMQDPSSAVYGGGETSPMNFPDREGGEMEGPGGEEGVVV